MTDLDHHSTVRVDQSDQSGLVHRLPPAELVDRIPYLCRLATAKRVVHVGFADAGYRDLQRVEGTWLHDHLERASSELVGIDLDERGVAEARQGGHEAHVADCCDPATVRSLQVEPAELVLAGEIIEHVGAPGSLLDGLRLLCRDDGVLVITTPNACGWVNPMAAVAGLEVNHPDHVVMFTWFTLTNLLRRHGWEPVGAATYVPSVKDLSGAGRRMQVLGIGARVAVAIQRAVAHVRPFVADGMIVVARPAGRY